MKKAAKGFTLIELVIVVAIMGVLAAIAIQHFRRYQLRAKFGELPTNVNAFFKAEESLRQSERAIPSAAGGDGTTTGKYFATGLLPAGCSVASGAGASKHPWVADDIKISQAIDWVVEGSTYGCYTGAVDTGSTVGTYGVALTINAESDIDGDGNNACVAIYQPLLKADGTNSTDPPDSTCTNKPTKAIPWGQVQRAPDDNTF